MLRPPVGTGSLRRVAFSTLVVFVVATGCGGQDDNASPGVSSTAQTEEPTEECPTFDGPDPVELPPADAPAPQVVQDEARTLPFASEAEPVSECDLPGYGRGAALVDLNGNGWDDLFLADTDNRWRGDDFGRPRVYRNEEGRFAPWDVGISDGSTFMNGAGMFADIDNDGSPDLLLLNGNNTGNSRLALYRNDLATTGTFTDITDGSGLSSEEQPWWGAAWGDLDGNGRLDLVVTGDETTVYRNVGGGEFVDVTDTSGVTPTPYRMQNPLLADFSGNGELDLFVAGLAGSAIYLNDGTGSFTEVTEQSGVAVESLRGVFSAAVADFDQDGHLDIWLGRWWLQDLVLLNNGDGTFTEIGPEAGIITQTWTEIGFEELEEGGTASPEVGGENTMGLTVADLSRNGHPDVIVGTGDPTAARPLLAFCAEPDPLTRVRFERCSEPLRSALGARRHHGMVLGDVDRSGFDDLIVNPGGFPVFDAGLGVDTRERPWLIRGVGGPEDASQTAHLRLKVGPGPRSAVGARVRVVGGATGRDVHGAVLSAQGFQSRNSDRLMLLTGEQAEVEITWPDGTEEVVVLSGGDDVELVQCRSGLRSSDC